MAFQALHSLLVMMYHNIAQPLCGETSSCWTRTVATAADADDRLDSFYDMLMLVQLL